MTKKKDTLKNCWEILKCGREKDGNCVNEHGECKVFKEKMGHSCWKIAGTYCHGEVQGTIAQKYNDCKECIVFKTYNRFTGTKRNLIKNLYPEEQEKFLKIIKDYNE